MCAFLVCAAAACAAADKDQCDVEAPQRRDCGVVGTTQQECEAKGCCWKEADPSIPWCFSKVGPSPRCSLRSEQGGAPFSEAEVELIRGFFLANIDIGGSGAVVAAPDHNTGPGGDYYFHWERDGALSMNALMRTAGKLSDVEGKLRHYVQWVDKVQNQPDPHGIDIRTEPKYTIPDGKPFPGPWCRPQNDGPGLRGKALAEYGLALLARGQPGDAELVRDSLWTGSSEAKHGGLVKYDLDWQADNWQSNGCDLWEEVQSNDFFWNRYTMRASLVTGARLAEKMGDAATAAKYRSVAQAIEDTLRGHFDGTFVFESQGRRKDAAVIAAFNVGDLGDGLFAPLSKEVLGTVITLNDLFCSTFNINRKDAAAGIPGILYGRYEGDSYDGGNPWVLLSAALAQLIYRQASAAANTTSVDAGTYKLLQRAYDIDAGLSGSRLGDALMGSGDGVMLRVKNHVQATGLHMAEQIGRDDGQMTSAKDLTWNYAEVLKAMHARDRYMASFHPAPPTVVYT